MSSSPLKNRDPQLGKLNLHNKKLKPGESVYRKPSHQFGCSPAIGLLTGRHIITITLSKKNKAAATTHIYNITKEQAAVRSNS